MVARCNGFGPVLRTLLSVRKVVRSGATRERNLQVDSRGLPARGFHRARTRYECTTGLKSVDRQERGFQYVSSVERKGRMIAFQQRSYDVQYYLLRRCSNFAAIRTYTTVKYQYSVERTYETKTRKNNPSNLHILHCTNFLCTGFMQKHNLYSKGDSQ